MRRLLWGASALLGALAFAGCSGAESGPGPVALEAAPFLNRSAGGQLKYLADSLPQTLQGEAGRVEALQPHEGKARISVTGEFSVQGESLTAVANWRDHASATAGSVEVRRRFGADAQLIEAIKRELAVRLLLDVLPQEWILHVRLGNTLRRQQVFGEAREAYRKAIAAAPGERERSRAWFLVGHISHDLHDPRGAVEAYEKALAADGANHEARYNLALTQLDQGDTAAGRATLEEARRRRPDDPAVRHRLAELAEAEGRPDDAVRLYREAVALAPREALPRYSLASALAKQGKYREAMQEYARVRAEHPSHRLTLYGMGVAAARMGDVDRAREYLGDFIAGARRDPSLGDAMAMAQKELNALK